MGGIQGGGRSGFGGSERCLEEQWCLEAALKTKDNAMLPISDEERRGGSWHYCPQCPGISVRTFPGCWPRDILPNLWGCAERDSDWPGYLPGRAEPGVSPAPDLAVHPRRLAPHYRQHGLPARLRRRYRRNLGRHGLHLVLLGSRNCGLANADRAGWSG